MRIRQIAVTIGLFLLMTTTGVRMAHASPMPLDGTWTMLDENLSDMTKPGFFDGDWSWTSSQQVEFEITDLYVVGDAFEVFDNGSPVASFSGRPDWSAIGGGCVDPMSA